MKSKTITLGLANMNRYIVQPLRKHHNTRLEVNIIIRKAIKTLVQELILQKLLIKK